MDVIALSHGANGRSGRYLRNAANRYDGQELELPNAFITADVAVGDVDADGDNDVILSGPSGTSILTNENGNFSIDGANNKAGGPNASLLLGDITHNGWADLIVASDTGVFRYTSNRAAPNQSVFGNNSLDQGDVELDWSDLRHGLLVDLTADGFLDVVGVDEQGGYLYEGLESGRFSLKADTGEWVNDPSNVDGPSNLVVFDADRD